MEAMKTNPVMSSDLLWSNPYFRDLQFGGVLHEEAYREQLDAQARRRKSRRLRLEEYAS
jgi:hypothetical protein